MSNPNGFAVYSKYNYCSRCCKYILKGLKCDVHPTRKLRTRAAYSRSKHKPRSYVP